MKSLGNLQLRGNSDAIPQAHQCVGRCSCDLDVAADNGGSNLIGIRADGLLEDGRTREPEFEIFAHKPPLDPVVACQHEHRGTFPKVSL